MSFAPKSWLAGLTPSVVWSPVPDRSALAGAAWPAVGVTVTVPVFAPVLDGSNCTSTVHDWPVVNDVDPAVHVPPLRLKPCPDDTLTVATSSVFGPEFVKVNV